MAIYGDTDCEECGRTFETTFTDGSYHIKDHNRTVVDYWPNRDKCDFCRGEVDCSEEGCDAQATVYDKEGSYDYCAPCWKKMCDGEEEEYEEFVFRLPENKQIKEDK